MEKITFSRTDISEDVLLQLTKTSEPGVVIGDGAVIAAGSVVTSNVAPRTLVCK